MKRLDPTRPGQRLPRLQVDVPIQLLERIEKLEKRFAESGVHYYRASMARHLIDLGLQCYERNENAT